MKRFALICTLVTVGCASAPKPRDPAGTVVAATPPDLMTQHFAEATATQAVLTVGEKPRCQVELYNHPELTPRYLTSVAGRRTVPLGLARCAPPDQNRIFEIVTGRDQATETPACFWVDAWAPANASLHRSRRRPRRAPAEPPVYKVLECHPTRAPGDAYVTYLIGPSIEAGRHF